MKKKQLKALTSIEKWLKTKEVYSDSIQEALERVRHAIAAVPEQDENILSRSLPAPAEIADSPGTFALYSDGGCRGNPGPGAFAFVIQEYSGEIIAEGVEFEGYTTNNKMELSGPIHGLTELKRILPGIGKDALLSKVAVITDSKYVVDGMKSWVAGWKNRGWKKADGKAPENLDLWQELDQLKDQFLEVNWIWVKGHGGHPQNEYCDQKANEAMDENIS